MFSKQAKDMFIQARSCIYSREAEELFSKAQSLPPSFLQSLKARYGFVSAFYFTLHSHRVIVTCHLILNNEMLRANLEFEIFLGKIQQLLLVVGGKDGHKNQHQIISSEYKTEEIEAKNKLSMVMKAFRLNGNENETIFKFSTHSSSIGALWVIKIY